MITTIKKLYDNNKEYLDSFFNNEIIISEKLSTFRILFENKNNKLIFYKKDYSVINKIERSLNNIWEDALLEIPILCENVNIPEGYIFGVSYSPRNISHIIPYNNIDKYILTDISRKNDKKIISSLSEDLVAEWSIKLNMGLPPVLYKGILTEEQKQLLIHYSLKNFEFIKENNFVDFFCNNFTNLYSKEKLVEGIILKSKDKIIQIKSHEFELLKESYDNKDNNRYLYDFVILYINNYLKE
ncbi:MAG: hypothetical protein RSE41_07840, partial [Clostridia bacterium]